MWKSKTGRLLIIGGFVALIVLFAWEVLADEIHIIEVRRNIPLSDNDPVYRDFYLNAGSSDGLKTNQVVTAVRKINVKDATGTQSFGELMVPVGQLKIIFAQGHIAVARERKILSREENPMLEQTGIMIGDQIDLKGSFVDNSKPSAKNVAQKENAPQEPKPAQPEAATVKTSTGKPPVEAKAAGEAPQAPAEKPAEPQVTAKAPELAGKSQEKVAEKTE